jgi:hypothetical protein
MKLIKIFDNRIKTNVLLQVNSDNILDGNYFKRTFPYANGIICPGEDCEDIIRSVRR